MASTLGEGLGDIDRVQQLAQSAKLINAFHKVTPADGRNSAKKDHPKPEDQADKLELTQEGEDTEELVLTLPPDDDDEHLDIAV